MADDRDAKDAGDADDEKTTFKDRLYPLPVIGTALRLQDRYQDDNADQHAAAIGFFAFLSLFPLLLLALAVAGFVLADDPAARQRLADSLIEAIPGFSGAFGEGDNAVRNALDGLSRNAGSVGLFGLVSLLLTGLRVINSANQATLAVFHVDVEVSGVKLRLRQLWVLGVLGILALAGVAASGLVGAAASLATDEAASAAAALGTDTRVVDGALQAVTTIAGLLASVAVDFLLFVSAYKLLSYDRGPSFRNVWPGALLAAVGWTGLKAFGATYVSGQIAKTNASIGALGGVVGLLLLLYLAGRVYVYGAELSALLRRPGQELAERNPEVEYEGEDPDLARPPAVMGARTPASAALASPSVAPSPVAEGTEGRDIAMVLLACIGILLWDRSRS